MNNPLNISDEEFANLDEQTQKALREGRLCPIEINLNISLGDQLQIPNNHNKE